MTDPASQPLDSAALDIARRPDYRWVVAHTRPRCEKKFHEFCRTHELLSYLPLQRSIRRYQRQVKEFMVPMFSGYVFAQVNAEQHADVGNCRQVAEILVPDRQMEEQLILELQDIQRIEQLTRAGELVVRPEIEVGRRVLIKAGPLAGVNGIVCRRKNKVRLTVNVEMIGQSVTLELDAAEVEIDD